MSVRQMKADGLRDPIRFYFACPGCGWCGPLRGRWLEAHQDEYLHFEAKAAAEDERR